MGRTNILSVLKNGKQLYKYPVRVSFEAGEGEMIFTVPKRHFKRAVKRNLLKRRMREAFRLNRSLLGDKKYNIFFFYAAAEETSYESIEKSIRSLCSDMAAD